MKNLIIFLFLKIFILAVIKSQNSQQSQDDDLEINILPSDKYRLNKRDLMNLKSDIERQLMQRVYELQSGWDQRRKLRQFALRPPMQPSLPYKSPIYNPNLLSLYAKPSPDGKREMTTINNAGFSGYSFSQKKNKRDEEIDPIESLKQQDEKNLKAKKLLEDEIDKKFELLKNEKIKIETQMKIPDLKMNLQHDIIKNNTTNNIANNSKLKNENNKNTENESSSEIKLKKNEMKKSNSNLISNSNKPAEISKPITKDEKKINPGLDYNSIADVMKKIFDKLNKNLEKSTIVKMIEGKDKDQIMQLISFMKEHPDTIVQPTENKKSQIEEEKENKLVNKKIDDKNEEEKKNKYTQNNSDDVINNSNINEGNVVNKKDDIEVNNIYPKPRFLSTKTEIKSETEDLTENSKVNSKSKINPTLQIEYKNENKENIQSNHINEKESPFVFQDGPINIDIF